MDEDVPNVTTPISGADEGSITIRGRPLSTEIMGELSFGEAAFLVLTGETPTDGERELFETMLTSLLAHGITSHVIATRLTFAAEPTSVQGAVASGLLGVGTRSAGAVRPCAETLQRLVTAPDTDAAVNDLIKDGEVVEPFGVNEFAGVGHAHFDSVDPRADVILRTAERVGLAGSHVDLLRTLQSGFEDRTGEDLPINVIGAISAAALDMGLSPVAAQGIAILSRTVGLVAEVEAERESPIAADIRRLVSAHSQYRSDE